MYLTWKGKKMENYLAEEKNVIGSSYEWRYVIVNQVEKLHDG